MAQFKKISSNLNLPEQEEAVLELWDKTKIFEKSLALRQAQGKRYVFFEGPPTANAKPGLHHLIARYFKDIFPRFKTMQGFLVERKAGWDTHGLPVEIAIEKKLGLKNKQAIEKYGVAEFNEQAKNSVWEYKKDWEEFTRRSGFWLDLEHPYITYDPNYIESVWWIIKQVWDKGLLYRGHKVVHYCPRCGTALSSHEVAQGYKEVEDTSIYVKFKLKTAGQRDSGSAGQNNVYILAWTTTPWTLPGNVALAVDAKIKYVKVKDGTDEVILAKDLLEKVFDKAPKIIQTFTGKNLVGKEYEPLFPGSISDTVENFGNAFKIYPADFVTTEDGTGVVHTAVMYGEDDYQLGEQVNLPKVHTVSLEGKFLPGVEKWAGKYVKDPEVEQGIVADLEKRGLLFKALPYKHEYPFCWRCDTALLYYAMHSWFIKMSQLRDKLIANNQTVNWIPEHIKEGRFGEWLKEVKDWAISRDRYWGTPLPLWRNGDDYICIGSFEELKSLAKDPKLVTGHSELGSESNKKIPKRVWDDKKQFNPHKPFVDEIVLVKDGKEYTRVPEVIDVWFDSGSMPFAQWHYPFENKERIDGIPGKPGRSATAFPADFIAEGIDQTRGWFYTLMAISTLLDKGAPYKNVLVNGHIMDKHGKKMSKSKGNMVDPWDIFNKYGSDVLRWHLCTINQPALPKSFDENELKQVTRRLVLTLWNTLFFFTTYANLDGWQPNAKIAKPKNLLDRWMLARVNEVITDVTARLEVYDMMNAGLAIEKLVDDTSNWYVRRSRKRFWKNEDTADKQQAYQTLYQVLRSTSLILAPFMPMFAEMVYGAIKTDANPPSVHLTDWPKATEPDSKLLVQMAAARRVVEAGHALREEAKIKVRQPLALMQTKEKKLGDELAALIADELNVKKIQFEAAANQLDTKLTPALEAEGLAREIVRAVQTMRKESGLALSDRIELFYSSSDELIKKTLTKFAEYIQGEILATEIKADAKLAKSEIKLNNHPVSLGLKKK
ncbi:isoleucine--tRNA ligase [Patescibacteria group bacterium]|nr:isoleucine--tRNA ligase [Patescibacteria group bacterium]